MPAALTKIDKIADEAHKRNSLLKAVLINLFVAVVTAILAFGYASTISSKEVRSNQTDSSTSMLATDCSSIS